MKFCKTAQIQIIGEQEKLIETVNQYVNAMNFVSRFARENNAYSKNKIQSHIYYDLRERFNLKSQMTINAIGDVALTYKGEHKKHRFKDKPVKFKSRSMRLNYPRDYSFKENNIVSINSLYGRLKVP